MIASTAVVIEDDESVAEKKGKQSAPGEIWTAVRLPEAVKEYLDEVARLEDRSVSYILRRLIIAAVERERGQGQ